MLKVIFYDRLVNFEIYKDLYGKPLKHDWVTHTNPSNFRRPFQLLLLRYDIRLKIYGLPDFNNMLFQFMRTTFFRKLVM